MQRLRTAVAAVLAGRGWTLPGWTLGSYAWVAVARDDRPRTGPAWALEAWR